jgi:hypothetical protein
MGWDGFGLNYLPRIPWRFTHSRGTIESDLKNNSEKYVAPQGGRDGKEQYISINANANLNFLSTLHVNLYITPEKRGVVLLYQQLHGTATVSAVIVPKLEGIPDGCGVHDVLPFMFGRVSTSVFYFLR